MKKLLTTLLVVGFIALDLPAADKPTRPNIVFLFADDLGIEGINCYGSDRFKDKTPNIDALAKTGLRFERCYSTPLCGPSRCQIMTGRYGFRTGGVNNQAAHIPSIKDEPSLAKTLKQAPNATAKAARQQLQAVLDQLSPATGKTAPKPDAAAKKAKRKAKRAAAKQ
jgi:arylsulfatase A-like enzyme